MGDSAVVCGMCHRPRMHGHHDQSGDVFICTQCQADAEQFIRIQDSIWDNAGQTTNAPSNGGDQQHP